MPVEQDRLGQIDRQLDKFIGRIRFPKGSPAYESEVRRLTARANALKASLGEGPEAEAAKRALNEGTFKQTRFEPQFSTGETAFRQRADFLNPRQQASEQAAQRQIARQPGASGGRFQRRGNLIIDNQTGIAYGRSQAPPEALAALGEARGRRPLPRRLAGRFRTLGATEGQPFGDGEPELPPRPFGPGEEGEPPVFTPPPPEPDQPPPDFGALPPFLGGGSPGRGRAASEAELIGADLLQRRIQSQIDENAAQIDIARQNADLARQRQDFEQMAFWQNREDALRRQADDLAFRRDQLDFEREKLPFQQGEREAEFRFRQGEREAQQAFGRENREAELAFRRGQSLGFFDGAPTLEREFGERQQNRADMEAAANAAYRQAELALRRGDQEEARRQFDIAQRLREQVQLGQLGLEGRRVGLEEELGRGRLGLESELGRRRAALEEARFARESAQDPYSFIEKTLALRGGGAAPTAFGPGPEAFQGQALAGFQRVPFDTEQAVASNPLPPAGPTEEGLSAGSPAAAAFSYRKAPLSVLGTTGTETDFGTPPRASFQEIINSPFTGRGLRAAFTGEQEPSFRFQAPLISTQKQRTLLPTERRAQGALLRATGTNPEDYFEAQNRLSETGTPPARTQYRRVLPRRLYNP